jgi:hypothetical protein
MKVVINNQHGGFSLSKEGYVRYCELKGLSCYIVEDTKFKTLGIFTCWTVPTEERVQDLEDKFYTMSMEDRQEYNRKYREQTLSCRDISRSDQALVQLVEEDSKKYEGRHATLKVVQIPDDVEYEIEEYDGLEWIAEKHRTWR